MRYLLLTLAFFIVFISVPAQTHAQTYWCDSLVGLCTNPYGNIDMNKANSFYIPPSDPYIAPAQTPIHLDQVSIPQGASAYLGANATECSMYPQNCAAAQASQTQCQQGGGTWTMYPTSSVLWPGAHCVYPVVSMPAPASVSSHAKLTSEQVAAILTLLQAFDAGPSVIANVRSALEQ